jgi:hypothetical protein
MSVEIKLSGSLYRLIMADLARPHPFAAERVGFVFGRIGSLPNQGKLILLNRYHSVPDSQYVEDDTVGARIGSEALTWAMQSVYYGRAAREGVFHIHVHEHNGEPTMSAVDGRDLPNLMPGFQSVGREAAHGIIVLSLDHGSAWVWLPGSTESMRPNTVSIIGFPLRVFERRTRK